MDGALRFGLGRRLECAFTLRPGCTGGLGKANELGLVLGLSWGLTGL